MKLFRSYAGDYFRSNHSRDGELTVTFSDNGTYVRLWPLGHGADVVTLSTLESLIFRLQPYISQAQLIAWSCSVILTESFRPGSTTLTSPTARSATLSGAGASIATATSTCSTPARIIGLS